jgi:arylsulfatase A-like enzyme
MMGNEELLNRQLYWEFGRSQAFRHGDWKLLQFKTKEGVETHLYHLADDAGETTNVAAQFPKIVSMLSELAMASRTKSAEFSSFLDNR